MRVNLVRRWGHQQPGTSVDVDDEQGNWLVNHNFAERPGQKGSASRGALAPGTDGPDPIISGDQTRSFPQTIKGEKRQNNALPVDGSPVQYNKGIAPEESGAKSGRGRKASAPAEKSGQQLPDDSRKQSDADDTRKQAPGRKSFLSAEK